MKVCCYWINFNGPISHSSYSHHSTGDNREAIAKQLEYYSSSNYHFSLTQKENHEKMEHQLCKLVEKKTSHIAESKCDNDLWQNIIYTIKNDCCFFVCLSVSSPRDCM